MPLAVFNRASILTGTWLAAAALLPCSQAAAQDASPFRPERFDEDWSAASEADAPFGAQFKNIEIIDGVTVSFGGDARWRFSYNGAWPSKNRRHLRSLAFRDRGAAAG